MSVVLFRGVLGEAAFEALPPSVRRVHGAVGEATFRGRGRARGSRHPLLGLGRAVLGPPQPARYASLVVTVAPDAGGETWTRRFGDGCFGSRLAARENGRFEERFGLLRFTFTAQARPNGFVWRFQGWGLGGQPLPRAWAPRLRARIYAVNGAYRFTALAAHPWLGVLFAYAGRLD